MKVFISWSGETSNQIAEELKSWLPQVIQEIEVFYSEEDIEKGSRWQRELADKLEEFSLGLACVTPNNLGEEWIAFEAGALSKNLDKSRVIPILFGDLEKSQLQGPLTQFDVATFNKEEMWRVVETIFKNMEGSNVDKETVRNTFNGFWPNLKEHITFVLESTEDGKKAETRSEKDMLKEVLSLARSIKQAESGTKGVEGLRTYWARLFKQTGKLVKVSEPANVDNFDNWTAKIEEILRLLKQINESYNLGYNFEASKRRAEEMIEGKREELLEGKDEGDEEIPF